MPGLLDLEPRHLHHRGRSGEILGAMLMTEHNLWFYQGLMSDLRQSIAERRLAHFAADFRDRYAAARQP